MPDGCVAVEPKQHCVNHKAEIVPTHFIEMMLYTLVRICSNECTQGLYFSNAQEAPFLNTELRSHLSWVGILTNSILGGIL
eukprot:SAG31_NODE_15288_length_762_cov_1.098039_2_plen_81_part_01